MSEDKEPKERKPKTAGRDPERESAAQDYARALAEVLEVKTMTDTPAWQRLYADVQEAIREHGRLVLDAERARDVVRHQEGVKILREVLGLAARPVHRLNALVRERPLFAAEFKTAAGWNEALGRVEVREK